MLWLIKLYVVILILFRLFVGNLVSVVNFVLLGVKNIIFEI